MPSSGRGLKDYFDGKGFGHPKRTSYEGASIFLWRKRSKPTKPPLWASIVREPYPKEKFKPPGGHENALLILRLNGGAEPAIWALAFGQAPRWWLRWEFVDREAPLIIALEILRDPRSGLLSGLTSVVSIELGREAQRITRDLPVGAELPAFQFDPGSQAMRRAEGKPRNNLLPRGSIAAGEGIHLTAVRSFIEALEAVKVFERTYYQGKKSGHLIPGILPITDSQLISSLGANFVNKIQQPDGSVAILLAQEQRDIALSASYDNSTSALQWEDYDVEALRSDLLDLGILGTLTPYELFSVRLAEADDLAKPEIDLAPLLSGSVTLKNRTYFLMDDGWFEIPSTWLERIGKRVDSLSLEDAYPEYVHKDENKYNDVLAAKLRGISLDKQFVRGSGFGRSKLEITDVLAPFRDLVGRPCVKLIANKRGALSQEMSHLITQATSAIDSLAQTELRENFYKLIKQQPGISSSLSMTLREVFARPSAWDPSRVEIQLGIIDQWEGATASKKIPVLARISLYHFIVRAAMQGHPVSLARIEVPRPSKKKAVPKKK